MVRSGVRNDLVILSRKRDIPEFVRDTASDDDALGPGLISGRAHFDGVFPGYDAGDMIALIQTIQVFGWDLNTVDFDVDLYRIGLEGDRTSVDEDSAFEVETVSEGIKKDASRNDAKGYH